MDLSMSVGHSTGCCCGCCSSEPPPPPGPCSRASDDLSDNPVGPISLVLADTGQSWNTVNTGSLQVDSTDIFLDLGGENALRVIAGGPFGLGFVGLPVCTDCETGIQITYSSYTDYDVSGTFIEAVGSEVPDLLNAADPGFLLQWTHHELVVTDWDGATPLTGWTPGGDIPSERDVEIVWLGTNLTVTVNAVEVINADIGKSPVGEMWAYLGGGPTNPTSYRFLTTDCA